MNNMDPHRMLKIVHCYFGYNENDSYEKKVKAIENRILDLKKKGFGGIVTNVGDDNYLHNETEWQLMKEKARICKENDMRMWIYDEKGYPSGAAETETISKDIDFEARAVVAVSKLVKKGETIIMDLPYKHEKTLNVMGFEISGERITEEELLSKPTIYGNEDHYVIKNNSEKNLLVLGFYKKHMFEGAHCQNNCCSSRRYIDVSNKDAVREFIDNTYKKYTDCLSDKFAKCIGDENENAVVEAIFTDEPSYMGHYINQGINTPKKDHEPDDKIPLYPVINWGRDVENQFANRYGYRIEDYLPRLFMGSSELSRKVRYHYNKLMSDLFAENFYGQLSDFCASKGLQFSGHTLLEDEIKLHVKFEGNIIKFLSKMHVPGIDMLQSIPEVVYQFAFTPILARSAATLYGKEHVMDEVSAHAQGGNVTIDQVKTSLMLQFVFGADVFTSYYDDNKYNIKAQKQMLDGLANVSKLVGKRNPGKTLVYYPIDTMMCLEKPDVEYAPLDNERSVMDDCQKNLEYVMYGFIDRQIPFLFADADSGSTKNFAEFEDFIIPGCFATEELVSFVNAVPSNANIFFIDETGKFEDQLDLLKSKTKRKILVKNKIFEKPTRTKGVCAVYGESADVFVNSTKDSKRIKLENYETIKEAFTGKEKKINKNGTVTIKGYETLIKVKSKK